VIPLLCLVALCFVALVELLWDEPAGELGEYEDDEPADSYKAVTR
jgi:hypothetical protein